MRRPLSGSLTSLKLPATHIRRPSRRVNGTVKLPLPSVISCPKASPTRRCASGSVVLGGPPRPRRRVRQALGPESEKVGEGGVDLDDGAGLVAEEEGFVQRVEQGRAPPGVVAAHARELHVGPDPREQFSGRERFDEIVVGARLQALDRGFLPGPGGQQQDRNIRGTKVRAQRRDELKAADAGHHHIADDDVRGIGPGGFHRGLPVGDGRDLVAWPQQPL